MKYQEIREIIRERVITVPAGQRLPGFRELMAEFGVSQATVSRALDILEQEGVIIRKHGIGILPASREGALTMIQRPKSGAAEKTRKILFSYAAYYSGGLWDELNTIEQYAVSRRIDLLFHKRTQETGMEEFAAYVSRIRKVAGVMFEESTRRLSNEELGILGSTAKKVAVFLPLFMYKELPPNVCTVVMDEYAAGRMLAEYLLERGHRRVGIVAHAPKCDYTELFYKGVLSRFQEAGHRIAPEWIFRAGTLPWDDSLNAAEKTVASKIRLIRQERLTALVFSSADGAIAAIRPLRNAGFRVPEEISLAGHGDMPFFANMPDVPATVTMNLTEAVASAIDHILSRKPLRHQSYIVRPVLKEYNGVTVI